MDEDLFFAFWADAGDGPGIHPADVGATQLIEERFDTRCLYGSYMGPLRRPRVVLLYSHPGLYKYDFEDVPSEPDLRQAHNSQRTGEQPLPDFGEHETAYGWWWNKLRLFEIDDAELDAARDNLAIFNLFPYHTKTLNSADIWPRIRSSQVARAFANNVLFPRARADQIVVVCMMAATQWGLVRGARTIGSLFTPMVAIGGNLFRNGEHAARRTELVRAVRRGLGLG